MRTVGWVLLMLCAPSVTSVLGVWRSGCRRAGLQYVAAVWVPALGLACMPVSQLDPTHGARLFKCDRSCWKSGLRSARFTNAHHRRSSRPPPQKMAADPVRCASQAMPIRTAALLRHISIMHLLSDSRISQERAGSVERVLSSSPASPSPRPAPPAATSGATRPPATTATRQRPTAR